MNVAGAAIATVGAQAVSVLLSLLIIRKKELGFRITRKDFRFGGEIGVFVKVGAPLALQEVLTNLTFLALCAFINRLGLNASSGYGIAQKIQSFIMLLPVLHYAVHGILCGPERGSRQGGTGKERHEMRDGLRSGSGCLHRLPGVFPWKPDGGALYGGSGGDCQGFRVHEGVRARGGRHQYSVQLYGVF